MGKKYLIIGAGFSGTVLANQLAQHSACSIDIWDERDHIAGNCHTQRDEQTGIMVHQYGPHIFNTDRKEIWDFVNSLVEFRPYVHRVKAMSNGKVYSLPVNLHTINQLFGRSFTPGEAKTFLETLADSSITDPQNFEEQALRFIGKELYYAFFYGYTKKQWGCEPTELPASILKRIPVRFNYDDNYHNNLFTGIPVDGYTAVMEKLVDHPAIHVTLNKRFDPSMDTSGYDHVFYTGPIDAWFDHKYGRLGYRTVTFETHYADGDFQGTTQMNFCDEDVPYTRITEHKHFTNWEQHDKTIYFKEFSKETEPADIPYYPKRLEQDKKLLLQYRHDAESLEKVSFLGRLATYRYMDMHHVIGEALDFAKSWLEAAKNGQKPPVFPNVEA
ncbi:MAG: UDP-galactopyranose mutase [Ferruginibacter sp.]|nr:UDP-galactopyranose mutase [Ferruginibacter sp.]MBU9936883.1 UDP-galactopyranose mutase [Ferruginibacter sp.]